MTNTALMTLEPMLLETEQPGQDAAMQAMLDSLWDETWAEPVSETLARVTEAAAAAQLRPVLAAAITVDPACVDSGWWDAPMVSAFTATAPIRTARTDAPAETAAPPAPASPFAWLTRAFRGWTTPQPILAD